MPVLRFIGRALRAAFRLLRIAVGLIILTYVLQYSTLPLGERWTAVGLITRHWQFDYITWELNALAVKANETLFGLHPFMDETTRTEFVRRYFADLERAQALEGQIAAVYTDPNTPDPDAASADLRVERDALRADLEARQGLAESILEGQVAAVLVDLGFDAGGQILPPIAAHFTQVPNLMVVSPRDEIRFDVAINLNPMTVDEQVALEAQVDAEQDVSSVIVPLGGIALYPSMILETASIPTALDVVAHEWLHHYLFAFPLGYSYDFAGEARIINETTAYQFGREVGRLVAERYYPDLVAPPPAAAKRMDDPPPAPQPPAFDFGAAMHETRTTVDELLAANKVEEAEAYMEERRRLFVANGYAIRKLNQAYFAFYGGYQSGAPGEGGSDPIGPAVADMRRASPSIYAWIVAMRGITTRDELLRARDALAPFDRP